MSLAASMRGAAGGGKAARRSGRGGVRRRGAVVLLLALAYAVGMLMFLLGGRMSGGGSGGPGVEVASLRRPQPDAAATAPPQPGSVYRSHLVFERLWPAMRDDATTAASASSLSYSASWRRSMLMTSHYQNSGEPWMPCVNSRLTRSELPPSNGYLIIEANGGLNQQRLSICDAVAVASLLNATFVIQTFHLNSVWRDPRVVRIAPFSNRLVQSVPSNIQALRCLVNYHALRFAEPIRILAEDLVSRMIKKSSLLVGNISRCIFALKRIWWPFHAVHMMVAGRRKLKWKMFVKGAGKGSFGDMVE